jgi:hypothetical protein
VKMFASHTHLHLEGVKGRTVYGFGIGSLAGRVGIHVD